MAKHEDFAHKTPTDDEQMAKHEDFPNQDLIKKATNDHAHDKNHDHEDAKANDEEGKMLRALKKKEKEEVVVEEKVIEIRVKHDNGDEVESTTAHQKRVAAENELKKKIEAEAPKAPAADNLQKKEGGDQQQVEQVDMELVWGKDL